MSLENLIEKEKFTNNPSERPNFFPMFVCVENISFFIVFDHSVRKTKFNLQIDLNLTCLMIIIIS